MPFCHLFTFVHYPLPPNKSKSKSNIKPNAFLQNVYLNAHKLDYLPLYVLVKRQQMCFCIWLSYFNHLRNFSLYFDIRLLVLVFFFSSNMVLHSKSL